MMGTMPERNIEDRDASVYGRDSRKAFILMHIYEYSANHAGANF